jgi:MoxR-like ATPase
MMATRPLGAPSGVEEALAAFDRLAATFAAARAEVERHVIGQSAVVEQALVALLAGGHGLLVGLPGLAKTRLVKTLGAALGLDTRRIQFTPDLVPSDILGAEVLETTAEGGRAFRFIPGPVFAELVMADEINRASPRTQSALLEAMAEGQVSAGGETRLLPRPFHVLATQNPIELEGTYPLPEAQLDRFLVEIRIDYPAPADERAILLMPPQDTPVAPVASPADLIDAQALVAQMPVGAELVDAVLGTLQALRPGADARIQWGPGPRAGQALIACARARAFLGGRGAPILDDVAALLPAVMRHRLRLTWAARAEGGREEALVEAALARL